MAGALSKRDIEMIFRADTDKATRPIGVLGKAVDTLTDQLRDQVKAAEQGDVSLEGLAATTRDLKKAQDELGTARALLTQLNSQEAALAKVEERAAAAQAKYEGLKAQVEGAEKPTKRLTNSLEAAAEANKRASDTLAIVSAEAQDTRERITAIIGPVESMSAGFAAVANTSKEIARGLGVAGAAADDFKAKLAGVSASEAKLNSDVSFEQAGRSAGLLQSQIDYLSQFENRVELLTAAKKELAAQNASFDAALQAQDAKIGAENVNRLRAAFEATAAEEQRIQSVNAFRQIAADANAAATDVTRFGTSADTTATSATRLAESIMSITNPAKAANDSIDGLEASITKTAGILDGTKKSAGAYSTAMNELEAANAAANRQAAAIDGYKAQEAALAGTTAKFQAAQAEVQRLAAVIPQTEQEAASLTRELKAAEAALETAGKAMQADTAKLDALGAGLRKAGHDTNDLAASEARLTAAAKQSSAAQGEIQGKLKGTTNAFGLSLQSAQNLGYQVNDIVTQLSLGQGLFRTLASQGGQLVQDPGITGLIGRYAAFIPIIAAVAAVFGTLAAAVSRANNTLAETKNAEGYIASLGEAGSLTADQIAKASVQMQDFGVSTEDARKAAHDFNEAGLDPQYLESFIAAAHNASDVTGKDFKEAFSALTDVMQGGYAEVEKLNEAFPVLSDAERVHIKAMFDSGQTSEARRIVFERFYDKMDEGAGKMKGAWSNAVDNFKAAFRGFLDYLGSTTVLQDFIRDTNNALTGLNYLLLRARGLSVEDAGRAAVGGGRAPTAPRPKGGGGPGAPNDGKAATSAEGQEAIANAKRELDVRKRLTAEERLRNAAIKAREGAPKGSTPAEREELATLAQRKEQNAINDERAKAGARASKHAESERNKAENAAKALAAKIAAAEESLQTGLDGINAKVAKTAGGSLSEQLQGAADAVTLQYDKLLRKADDFAKLTGGKGTINGKSIADYKAEIEAGKVQLTQQAQLKVYEDNLNAALDQRKQLLADIEDKRSRGSISSADSIKQTAEVTSRFAPIIATLTTAAETFARSIGGANPSPQLQAFIAKMERINAQASTADPMQGDVAKAGQAALGAEESKLNEIISQRNNLIAANNVLVELGLKTQKDAQAETANAFKTTQPLIAAQVGVIQQTIDALKEQGAITPQLYDTWVSKLAAVTAQSQYTNANVLALNNLVQGQLLQGGSALFESFAKGLAGLATGTESVGQAFGDLLSTFLNFAAQFLQKIAEMIIQALILQAIQSALGVPGGGGGGGLGGLIFGGVKHDGGTVGDYSKGNRRRAFNLSPGVLSAIPRYHEGTQGAGLKKNEMLAVLEKGEKVTTEEQQRKEAAQGAGGSGPISLRPVLAFGDDEIAGAMSGPAGEKTTLFHIKRNKTAIKQLLRD